MDWVKSANPNVRIYARSDLITEVDEAWFEPGHWQRYKAVVGESKGRNTTYFIAHKRADNSTLNMVLRHYYRGGLVRKFSDDKFVYTGLRQTRSVKELTMLTAMCDLGLPVPKPVAARVVKSGLSCSNDILIETIPNTKDGYNHLKSSPLSDEVWLRIGTTIKQFHQAGVYHSDLNIHNILIDTNGKVFLIDFDNCQFRPNPDKWSQNNILRLRRSLDKEKSLLPKFNFSDENWQTLLTGYGQ